MNNTIVVEPIFPGSRAPEIGTEAFEKPTQKRGRKKSTQIQLWINFFRKSIRPAAKMAPGRHPKVDQKSIKNHLFRKSAFLQFWTLTFRFQRGLGVPPSLQKHRILTKTLKSTPTNILNESLGKKIGVSSPLIKDYVWVMICRHWYPEARKTPSEMQFPVLVACLVVCLLRHTIVASSPGL